MDLSRGVAVTIFFFDIHDIKDYIIHKLSFDFVYDINNFLMISGDDIHPLLLAYDLAI